MCQITIHPMANKGVAWNITFAVFSSRCTLRVSSCFLEDTPERPSVVNASFHRRQEGLSQTLTIQPQTRTSSWEMHTSTLSEPIFRLRPVRGCYSTLCKWDEGDSEGHVGQCLTAVFILKRQQQNGKQPISRFQAKKRNWPFRFRRGGRKMCVYINFVFMIRRR